MLKRLIVIERDNQYQCDTEQELVQKLIHPDYYKMSAKEKLEKMKMKTLANTLGNPMDIVEPEDVKADIDVEQKFILYNEKTYILSLLQTNKIMLLERIDSNVFIGDLEDFETTKNYVIVNKFANEILKNYLNHKLIEHKETEKEDYIH